jgi:hypothetical protein
VLGQPPGHDLGGGQQPRRNPRPDESGAETLIEAIEQEGPEGLAVLAGNAAPLAEQAAGAQAHEEYGDGRARQPGVRHGRACFVRGQVDLAMRQQPAVEHGRELAGGFWGHGVLHCDDGRHARGHQPRGQTVKSPCRAARGRLAACQEDEAQAVVVRELPACRRRGRRVDRPAQYCKPPREDVGNVPLAGAAHVVRSIGQVEESLFLELVVTAVPDKVEDVVALAQGIAKSLQRAGPVEQRELRVEAPSGVAYGLPLSAAIDRV